VNGSRKKKKVRLKAQRKRKKMDEKMPDSVGDQKLLKLGKAKNLSLRRSKCSQEVPVDSRNLRVSIHATNLFASNKNFNKW
jgi:hypothetical protein